MVETSILLTMLRRHLNWSYKTCQCAIKSSPPTNQHPTFYRPHVLPITQPTVSKHWRGKYHIPGHAHPKLTLGLPALWPLKAPGYLGWALLWLSSALTPVPNHRQHMPKMKKKRSEATQTLRTGCIKADPQTNKPTNRQGRLQYTAQRGVSLHYHQFEISVSIFTVIMSPQQCEHPHNYTYCKSQAVFELSYWCLCGSVAEWLDCWNCDQQVMSSNPGQCAASATVDSRRRYHKAVTHPASSLV